MSDTEEISDEKPFCVDRPKQGRAACKKCKQKCLSGEVRIAKLSPNPFGAGKMKNWFHVDCIFEQFLKQRVSTKKIDSSDDIDGWDDLSEEDQNLILEKIKECNKAFSEKHGVKAPPVKASPKKNPKVNTTPQKKVRSPVASTSNSSLLSSTEDSTSSSDSFKKGSIDKDLLFREFRRLVADITNVNSYTEKTSIISRIFTHGSDGTGFKGDIIQWCRLLLPGVVKRVYNLQSKQLIKLFSKIFQVNQNDMLEHFEQGDIGETIQHYFEESRAFQPAKKSLITIQEVDNFLEELSMLTREDEQMRHFKAFTQNCTGNDLKIIIRLIKGDLRINAGAKHVLDAIHPDAYEAYQASRDLPSVISRCLKGSSKVSNSPTSIKAKIMLMTPVLPMLAEACKSIDQAMKKCPNGMYSEVKYDGERVQVHKKGNEFKYFSRSLKPVAPHKVNHFKDYIPQAFPHGKDLILDSEVLLIDTSNGKPLPFGSLGVHKKNEFKNANVCLFVFDCIYYNGEDLTNKPIKYRKKILKEMMTEIPNHIVFSEMEIIEKPEQLALMIAKVLKLGLEGLVLKDTMSIYEPGKRHWLKVKKDYLFGGAMADTADLIVLGAWFGTGKKGGMMSIFLMGCYDPRTKKFCTVTKVHTGHDDKTLERLQDELDMVKISSDATKLPDWLKCTKTMIPDFVARDPKNQPVWEITGAEFTKHEVHTANGISIRFPRVTKIRDDKNWETATNLNELQELFEKSKTNSDISEYLKDNMENEEAGSSTKKDTTNESTKRKHNSDSENETSKKDSKEKKKKRMKTKTNAKHDKSQSNSTSEDSFSSSNIKDESETDNCSSKIEIAEPLPVIFANVKLLVEEKAKEKFEEWIRFFIAYGGEVVEDCNSNEATHFLHCKDTVSDVEENCPSNVRHVIVEWIKNSIANKKLEDYKPYSVRWVPKES